MPITAAEQYGLELINRARLNPAAEAARYGVGLNAGVTGDKYITTAQKHVLAPNEAIALAAEKHSIWVLNNDNFTHNANGQSQTYRMEQAGFQFTGTWHNSENMALVFNNIGSARQAILEQHKELMQSKEHRPTILSNLYSEVGLGQVFGNYQGNKGAMLTQDFAGCSDKVFVTGVAYTDKNHNNFYDIGEGKGSVQFSEVGGGRVSTAAPGGYALKINPASSETILINARGVDATVRVNIDAGNVKLDLVGQDTIFVTGNVTIIDGIHNARLLGIDNSDLTGSRDANRLIGNLGGNELNGGAGADSLYGGAGSDRLNGGNDNDRLYGDQGRDTLSGGNGTDTADYSASRSAVSVDLSKGVGSKGDATGDRYYDVENIAGSRFGDILTGSKQGNTLFGGAGNDKLNAGAGDDILIGGQGRDALYGGEGMDTANYAASRDAVNINLGTGAGKGGDADGDSLSGVENVIGSKAADILTGNALANSLFGGSGADKLIGGAGDDALNGGAGNDNLTGGAGADQFVFGSGSGADTITDFHMNDDDVIVLNNALWGGDQMLAQAVIDEYASDASGKVVFDFGGGQTLTLTGVSSLDGLADFIRF